MRYVIFATFCLLSTKATGQKNNENSSVSQKFLAVAVYYKPLFIANDRSLQARSALAIVNRKRLSFGPLLDVSLYKNKPLGVISSNQVLIGPFARYFFKGKKVAPFIEVSVAYGLSVQKYTGVITLRREPLEVSSVPGISLKLNQKCFVDLQMKLSVDFNESANHPTKNIEMVPFVGLHYSLTP